MMSGRHFFKSCSVDVPFKFDASQRDWGFWLSINHRIVLHCRKLFSKKVVVTHKIVGSKRQLSPACLRHFSNWLRLRWQTWRQTLTSYMPVASHRTFFKNISLTNLAVKDNLWLLLMQEGKSIKSNWQTW